MVFRLICRLGHAGELGQQPGTIVVAPEPDLDCLVVGPSGNAPVSGQGGVVPIGAGLPIVNWCRRAAGAIGEMNIADTGVTRPSPNPPTSTDTHGLPSSTDAN